MLQLRIAKYYKKLLYCSRVSWENQTQNEIIHWLRNEIILSRRKCSDIKDKIELICASWNRIVHYGIQYDRIVHGKTFRNIQHSLLA